MSFSFRPLQRADFSILRRWLSEPHVKAWWHEELSAEEIEAKYGPRVDGIEPTHVFVILHGENPIGLIQYYLWKEYPDHAAQLGAPADTAGIDLAIGEKEMIGRGLGSQIISEFVKRVAFTQTQATAIITDPEVKNLQSLKAFQKAGFTASRTVQLRDEDFRRQVVVFHRPAATQRHS